MDRSSYLCRVELLQRVELLVDKNRQQGRLAQIMHLLGLANVMFYYHLTH